jgi:hypothetical protein
MWKRQHLHKQNVEYCRNGQLRMKSRILSRNSIELENENYEISLIYFAKCLMLELWEDIWLQIRFQYHFYVIYLLISANSVSLLSNMKTCFRREKCMFYVCNMEETYLSIFISKKISRARSELWNKSFFQTGKFLWPYNSKAYCKNNMTLVVKQ